MQRPGDSSDPTGDPEPEAAPEDSPESSPEDGPESSPEQAEQREPGSEPTPDAQPDADPDADPHPQPGADPSPAGAEASPEGEASSTAADPDPSAAPREDGEAEGEDLSELLVSDEPEEQPTRVRVRSSDDRQRVDRSERLRNYYANLYRPSHNPSRLYFAGRAAYSLAGTREGTGGGRMAFVNAELGQTWNFIGYGIGATVLAGSLTFGEDGVEKFGGVIVGGGPSLGLGRLGLLGRGYIDLRAGYNFFYAPVSSLRAGLADPPDAAPHGPKLQIDVGLFLHGTERRRFRHGLGVSLGWQMLAHTFVGEFPMVNAFNIGVGYFFG